jgi:phosphohistidine phosphatase
MRTLILLRHAKAERPEGAQSDEERRLTGRGRRDAEAAGAAIVAQGLAPTHALISPAARTRETAELALAGMGAVQTFENSLYHAASVAIWQAFFDIPAERVIIIGHNPGLAELVSMLIAQAHDNSSAARDFMGHFPTAAWAAFELSGEVMRAAGPRLIAAWKPPKDKD